MGPLTIIYLLHNFHNSNSWITRFFSSLQLRIRQDWLYMDKHYGRHSISSCIHQQMKKEDILLTLTLLTWTKWWAPTNGSKWRMGFNSAFKGLNGYGWENEKRKVKLYLIRKNTGYVFRGFWHSSSSYKGTACLLVGSELPFRL